MEDIELKKMWSNYSDILNAQLVVNKEQAKDITQLKVLSMVGTIKPLKLFAIIVGVMWVVFVDYIILNTYAAGNWYFIVAAGLQSLICKIAIGVYLYQMSLIYQIDLTMPLLKTQEKLARLIKSTLWVTRILILQLPLWFVFMLNSIMISEASSVGLIFQVFITSVMLIITIWLFVNIDLKNKDKAWFRKVFKGSEWDPIFKSQEMLTQLDEYKS